MTDLIAIVLMLVVSAYLWNKVFQSGRGPFG
jgi:hypothetical protein